MSNVTAASKWYDMRLSSSAIAPLRCPLSEKSSAVSSSVCYRQNLQHSKNLMSSIKQFCKLWKSNGFCSVEKSKLISTVLCFSGSNSTNLNSSSHDARILYSVAAAIGHNQESHPESNLRVPAIVNALEKSELTSQYRASEVLEIQNFQPATVDEIAAVHERRYISGLERAMSRASDEGLIFIDGSGPTYATETVYHSTINFLT